MTEELAAPCEQPAEQPESRQTEPQGKLTKLWDGLDLGNVVGLGKGKEEGGIRDKVTVVEESDITFDDVGGNKKAKEALRELAGIIKGSKAHKAMGAEADRGYLLYGPSGNGKTELARALAGETGAIVIIVNYQDLASRWVNETPENIKALFAFARQEAERSGKPVIIFFDEADALFVSRDGPSTHSMHTTALAALLSEMDGAHASNDRIFVIGATNHPEGIDPAAQRRFEHKIAVPNPSENDRVEILQIHRDRVRKKSLENGYGAAVFSDSPQDPTDARAVQITEEKYWRQVAQKTEGFSGAMLATLVRRSARKAADKLQQAMQEAGYTDVDEYLANYPDALRTASVSAQEVCELAEEIRQSETTANKQGQIAPPAYRNTGKGYFGTN
ncbi:MAG: ATP-binding protein [Patescibacteria group bacterium]|nr:ATP-binding protein [Patescibacteria group bacterium]MDE2589154.1 ATP-binding protein [Patescibacteria group bacterium]